MPRPCRTYADPHTPARPWCPLCRLDLDGGPHHRLWHGLPQIAAAKPKKATATPIVPCVHLGPIVHPPRAPDAVREYHECEAGLGVCTECRTCGQIPGTVKCGPSCGSYVADADTDEDKPMQSIAPRHTTRINPARLEGSAQGRYLNPSIIDFEGKRLLAYRAGIAEARIWITELGSDLQPIGGAVRLNLTHPSCLAGQEDPRLFVFGGQLHLSFTGVDRRKHGPLPIAHVMLARLDAGLGVDEVWIPEYRQRTETEKNWVFFAAYSAMNDLACVYSGDPHRVLLWDYSSNRSPTAMETSSVLPWTGGLIRGGASPYLSEGEYYHWFHGVKRVGPKSHYTIGLYTFDAEPPFRIKRMTRSPILVANDRECAARSLHKHSIVFPCGAILDGERWLVSYGHHDHYCEIAEFDRQAIENTLEVVKEHDYRNRF